MRIIGIPWRLIGGTILASFEFQHSNVRYENEGEAVSVMVERPISFGRIFVWSLPDPCGRVNETDNRIDTPVSFSAFGLRFVVLAPAGDGK